MAFTQYFGSHLQLTPHLHVLLPEGLWEAEGRLIRVPPPTAEEVGAVLRRVLSQLARKFEGLEEGFAEDALDALRMEAVQQRLVLEDAPSRVGHSRRLAVYEGFSLHADTWVHEGDRKGLERLCRYGSRGPVVLERLTRRDDGRYVYTPRKGPALVFTAEQLVKRLVALIPPRGVHLTRFHGVFAPNARLRRRLMRRPAPPAAEENPKEPSARVHRARRRMDWATLQRRTFDADVWACPCGGRRRVLAVVSSARTAEEVLRNLGLLPPRHPRPNSHAPPQLTLAV